MAIITKSGKNSLLASAIKKLYYRKVMSPKIIASWQNLPELKKLGDLALPPKQLYYLGKWSTQLFTSCVAVVGSRKITDYGCRVVEKVVTQLVLAKKTVVSGFMYGVDQYAHQICLEKGGSTIAVLGWGIDWPLSDLDQKLADKIISRGVLLSEWGYQRPTLWTFPQRNRLITALSDEVIVVEASLKSGSLITAQLATKLKRTLWAVPGPITSNTSVGTNLLIAQGKARSWLGEYSWEKSAPSDPILSLLENQSLTADEISLILNRPIATVGAQLSLFVISGSVSEHNGKYFLKHVD